MAKVSKVELELQEATGAKPKKGEDRQDYLKRVHGAISDLDDAAWKKLSTPAMNWGNAATKAFDKDKPLPDFEEDADAAAKPAKGKAAAKADADEEDPGEGAEDDASDETETDDNSGGDDADAEDKTVKTKTTKKAAAKPAAKKPAAAPAKADPKAKTKAAAPAPAKKKAATGSKPGQKGDGYKGHRVGSNKETVHKIYDEKGREAALKKASSLGLADNTARSWASSWGPSPADKGKK